MARDLDMATVPVLFWGQYFRPDDLKTRMAELMAGPSALGSEKEGLVVRKTRQCHRLALPDNVCTLTRHGYSPSITRQNQQG